MLRAALQWADGRGMDRSVTIPSEALRADIAGRALTVPHRLATLARIDLFGGPALLGLAPDIGVHELR